MNKSITLKYHAASLLWALLIVLLSGLPGDDLPHLVFWDKVSFDKLTHAFFYAVLVVLITVGLVKQYRFSSFRKKSLRIAFAVTIVFGFAVEVLQALVFYNRSAELTDLLANTIGCLLGVLYFKWNFGECLKASKW